MALDATQRIKLAEQINLHSNLDYLRVYAADIGITLPNIAPGANLFNSAFALIEELHKPIPPRIDELLELLRAQGNAALKAFASQLLTPGYYSPTGDPHDAIVLGRAAFVARDELRRSLRDFTSPSPFTTRVLIVRGNEPGGKSYSYEFLRHLAFIAGARPMPLHLKRTSYTPREFMEQVYAVLGMDASNLPELKDDPQLARVDPLINAFKGRLSKLTKPYWLVIDDLNDPGVRKEVRETAYALAYTVEDVKADNLWVALLGYNDLFDESELRHIARDDAEFPSPQFVAQHLEKVSQRSQKPLTSEEAQNFASLLFSKYPKLDKEAMMKMTIDMETLGNKLERGLRP